MKTKILIDLKSYILVRNELKLLMMLQIILIVIINGLVNNNGRNWKNFKHNLMKRKTRKIRRSQLILREDEFMREKKRLMIDCKFEFIFSVKFAYLTLIITSKMQGTFFGYS